MNIDIQSEATFTSALNRYVSHRGQSFAELSAAAPVLLVFLRHLQCPFCRSMLREISLRRRDIEAKGMKIAIVHMAREQEARKLFAFFNLEDIPRFADQSRELYRLAGLRNLKLRSLFNRKHIREGWQATRELRGAPQARGGSLLQMPGVFLIDQGHVVAGESILHYDDTFDWQSLLDAA